MNKKGFTLIEILGITVVLAIIAVITVPLISGIIVKVRKASYKDSIYGIIESAHLYLASNISSIGEKEIEFICNGISCSRENGDNLIFKGSVPKSGSIFIKGNDILIESVYNGKYYANNSTGEVVITEEDTTLTRGELTNIVNDLTNKYNDIVNKNNDLQNQINNLKDNTTSINGVYPVGSIYITTSNVNPSTLFAGTTWERYGTGRTLLGTDSTSGEIGGSNIVSLTSANLPSHNHTVTANGTVTLSNTTHTHSIPSLSGTTGRTGKGYSIGYTSASRSTSNAGSHTHNVNLDIIYGTNTGGNAMNSNGRAIDTYHFAGTAQSAGAHEHSVSDSYANKISGVESHSHSFTTNASATGNNGVAPTATFNGSNVATSSVGTGSAFNIQNPYITVYMWKRIS